MTRHSAIFEGRVRHRRYGAVPHAFTYRLAMMWLDLEEIDHVFAGRGLWSVERRNLVSFRRADYLGDAAVPLDVAVRDAVEARIGRRPGGPIRMLTNLRTLGHCFNPVTFYYGYDAMGVRLEWIVAEITNTPWGERHAYVLPRTSSVGSDRRLRFRFGKSFHVSPFLPMDVDCDWRFVEPGRRLAVHMANLDGGAITFDASLSLSRTEITASSLARILVTWPFGTLRILGAIYWQALRLWLKGASFHRHPSKRTSRTIS